MLSYYHTQSRVNNNYGGHAMKLKSLLLGLTLVAAIAANAFAATESPNNSATPVTLSASTPLSAANKGNVGTNVSDGYVVEDIPGENNSTLEFWEIVEFEDWMEQQRAENQKLADSGDKSFYEKNADGNYICREWTQKDVDALYAEWQEQLALMKQGYRFTKSIVFSDGSMIFGVFDPETRNELPQTAPGSTIITLPNGSMVDLGKVTESM